MYALWSIICWFLVMLDNQIGLIGNTISRQFNSELIRSTICLMRKKKKDKTQMKCYSQCFFISSLQFFFPFNCKSLLLAFQWAVWFQSITRNPEYKPRLHKLGTIHQTITLYLLLTYVQCNEQRIYKISILF